jgi:hypothetical protein
MELVKDFWLFVLCLAAVNTFKNSPSNACFSPMGLYHPLDGDTNLKSKLLCFLTPDKKIQRERH